MEAEVVVDCNAEVVLVAGVVVVLSEVDVVCVMLVGVSAVVVTEMIIVARSEVALVAVIHFCKTGQGTVAEVRTAVKCECCLTWLFEQSWYFLFITLYQPQ